MLSTIILTKNEEKNIIDCLESVDFSDEIIVIDDHSTDRTVELIKHLQDPRITIFTHTLNNDFAAQRNFGLEKAKGSWILFVDADERISETLKVEILRAIEEENRIAYMFRRHDILWGRTLQYGEIGAVRLLRLAMKKIAVRKWKGSVHEVWDVKGLTGEFETPLLHYPHQQLTEFIAEINHYSSLRAQELFQKGVRTNWFWVIVYPKAKFIQNYFFRQGYKDGVAGFIVAMMMSFHSFLVRGKLYLLSKNIQ